MEVNKPELGNQSEQPKPTDTELPQTETEETVMDATPEQEAVTEETATTEAAATPDNDETTIVDESEDAPSAGSNGDDIDEEEESADETPQAERPTETSGLKRGDLLEGTVTRTLPTAVYVDLGEGREGIVPSRELERMSRSLLEQLTPGNTIPVFVVNPRARSGIILSVHLALEELDWRKAEEYRQSKEVYDGRIAGYNKGGLIVRFGRLRGFVPHSQVSDTRLIDMQGETPEERYGKMVNQPIAVKVMEVDRGRNRLILSERAAAREVRERRKAELIEELQVGEVRTGRVVSIEDFGAFVDIGGAEGLVHRTELSWTHVAHPRDVVKLGQEVTVEVISVDRERKRIGLSMKNQQEDPWDIVAANYSVGQLVQATVTKLTKFGAFARLVEADAIEGLIHISELSDERVKHPREVVQIGETLTLRVVKVDVKNRRLGLSLKRVNSAEYLDYDLKFAAENQESEDSDE
ncbi:MAG: S1 RNA-binding domain-containing protein [Chloroflexi bacterium]|nr:MAG: S1 RNA-binding domain-containing protein [Chloroflexota bacterium]